MSALSYDQLAALADNRRRADAPCPLCGPDRRAPANRRRKVLRIYAGDRGFYSYNCARCGARGYAHAGGAARSEPSTLERMAARKRRVHTLRTRPSGARVRSGYGGKRKTHSGRLLKAISPGAA